MEHAGEILGRTMRRLDRPEAALAWILSAWPSIVGPSLAMHARPVRCNGGCLELATDGKIWEQQFESMKKELLARVNRAWGANLVREVKFVAGKPAEKLSHESDNTHTPFIRRQRA